MELIVTLGDREEKVHVQHTPDGYEVRVGETAYAVDNKAGGAGLQSFLIREEAKAGSTDGALRHQREVYVHAEGGGRYQVRGPGPIPAAGLTVADPLTHLAQVSRGGAGRGGKSQVTAYMPGRVVSVLVEEGAEVTEGQGIVVLEAMKMENEIPAESAGTLSRLLVEPGQAVDAGDPLFEIT